MLQPHTESLLKYWQACLLDSQKLSGRYSKAELGIDTSAEDIHFRKLTTQEIESGILSKQHFAKFPKNKECSIALYAWEVDESEYGSEIIIPLFLPIDIGTDGKIRPKWKPFIPHDLLCAEYSSYTVWDNEIYKNALNHYVYDIKSMEFKDFFDSGLDLLRNVFPELYNKIILNPYDNAYFTEKTQKCFATHILKFYNNTLKIQKYSEEFSQKYDAQLCCLPLLESICSSREQRRNIPEPQNSFRSRLGHYHKRYSLSSQQRVAAGTLTHLQNGEILAVNGPPGTGKTTLLSALIAANLVASVLEDWAMPPITVAAASTNQAVTNILEGFNSVFEERSGLYGHWIPTLESIGSYFHAKSKGCKSSLHTEEFFPEIACDSDIEKLQTLLVERCSTYSGQKVQELTSVPGILKRGIENIAFHLNDYTDHRAAMEIGLRQQKWLRQHPSLTGNVEAAEEDQNMLQSVNDAIQQAKADIKGCFESSIADKLEEMDFDFTAFDAYLDISLRRKMFWLAVHYWEARWCLAIEDARHVERKKYAQEELSPGELEKLWRLRMMLTPCAVCTLYSLPNFFSAHLGGDTSIPLYNCIDLLILEEAGQTAPEIAVPAFALAKRAVVVGDDAQLQPISSTSARIDGARAQNEGLDPDLLREKGQLCTSGSALRMAQAATTFSSAQDNSQPAGIFLKEHFRCLPQILKFCNYLSYNGQLVSLRDEKPKIDMDPLMGLHVQGQAQPRDGSWLNMPEAQAVAAWVKAYAEIIRTAYKKELGECLAIVTPYREQAQKIREALKKVDIAERITAGTIHELQGAERPIILFSPVMTIAQKKRTFFCDTAPNILNVAVSRAQDNFIVIGDINLPLQLDRDTSCYGRLGSMLQIEIPRDIPGMPTLNGKVLIQVEEHDAFLQNVLRNEAQKFVIIYSPWVNESVVDSFRKDFTDCMDRGVKIYVIYDDEKNSKDKNANGLKMLRNMGISVQQSYAPLHAKPVFCDTCNTCTGVSGSFNWLSAHRAYGKFRQIEHSIVYTSPNQKNIIRDIYEACHLEIPQSVIEHLSTPPKMAWPQNEQSYSEE